MIQQILLITDGCSNVGMDPCAAAAHAASENITVNVVGVIDDGSLGEHGAMEIREIARAGGGMSRIVTAKQLSQTVQMVTRRTVTHTLHQVVQHELKHILDKNRSEERSIGEDAEPSQGALAELPPGQRAEVVKVIDEMSESSLLKVALLIDASASMRPKLNAVREAIYDLMLSLQARKGDSEIAVFHFPGKKKESAIDLDWTNDLSRTNDLFRKLTMKGTTPTGPAIMDVVQYVLNSRSKHDKRRYIEDEPSSVKMQRDGITGDYFG